VVCSLVLESRLPALDQAIHRARRLAGCETRPPPHAPGWRSGAKERAQEPPHNLLVW